MNYDLDKFNTVTFWRTFLVHLQFSIVVGYPQELFVGLFHGKSKVKMDDLGYTPWLGKPPNGSFLRKSGDLVIKAY
jgi:hypothetical protein